MRRRAAIRTGIVLLAALTASAAFVAVGRADDPRFDQIQSSLGPSPVSAGANVLYKAQWHYIDNQTLTHPSVVITIPSGWTLVSPSDPTGCTQSGTTITCARGTIRQGDFIRQSVELTTSSALGVQTVTSNLTFYEGPRNPGRINHVFNLPASTQVISGDASVEPNRAGKCVDKTGGSVSTASGVGGSSTSALVPATTDLCTPISLEESPRANPNDACLTGLQCTTEIVTTKAPAFSSGNAIRLTIVFYGTGLNNLPLIFNGGQSDEEQVPSCTAPGPPDPCFSDHANRQHSVTWSVNWSGRDPSWTS